MLVLTTLAGHELLVAPEHIVMVGRTADEGAIVHSLAGNVFPVAESPMDVARLRAAWEKRHNVTFEGRPIQGELPIAVEMSADGIRMRFCEHSHRAREAAEAQRRERGLPSVSEFLARAAKRERIPARDHIAEGLRRPFGPTPSESVHDQA